jgi:hypothetical protein
MISDILKSSQKYRKFEHSASGKPASIFITVPDFRKNQESGFLQS